MLGNTGRTNWTWLGEQWVRHDDTPVGAGDATGRSYNAPTDSSMFALQFVHRCLNLCIRNVSVYQ
jgi:hypothetical protein